MSPLNKKVLIVTGKGGTGKTTAAAALGVWSANQGLNTLLVECNGARSIASLFDQPPNSYTPQRLRDSLFGMSITSDEAIEDFVIKQIKVRALYSMVFRNRVMGPFMDAVPGLHDAVHLGKVYDLVENEVTNGRPTWDRIIVDAPATGHGLHMLNASRSMMDLTRTGPIHENAKLVHTLTSDRAQTGLIMTCLPEEMPVSETLELNDQLSSAGYSVSAIVLNEMVNAALPDSSTWPEVSAALTADGCSDLVDLVERHRNRGAQQADAQSKLRTTIKAPLFEFPMLLSTELGLPEINRLAGQLNTPVAS
jgi:anion-transporting  ArsA/GET3 family ATPase